MGLSRKFFEMFNVKNSSKMVELVGEFNKNLLL